MKPFAAKLASGQQVLGFGLSEDDLAQLREGRPVVVDLSSVGVGIWVKEVDGKRSFLQPANSNVLLMFGDRPEDIGKVLQVDLSSLNKQ
jgi:hypothetical protein